MRAVSEPVTFGPFRLAQSASRLERDGAAVDLRPQALAALEALLHHTGRYVDYDSMIHEAWAGVVVSKHTVAVTVGEVKRALQEFGEWISYRPRLGYRLEVPHSEDLVRQGIHFGNRFTREGLERALELYRRAATQDSNDLRAIEGLANTYLLLGTFGMQPAPAMYQAFLDAHRRAVAVGGMTPDLRGERGHGLHVFEHKLVEAEAELRRAHAEKPESGTIRVRLAMFFATTGRLDEGWNVLAQAPSGDSLKGTFPPAEVFILTCRGEVSAAIDAGARAVDLHPYMPLARALYADALNRAGRGEEALKQYQHACLMSPDLPWLRAMEGAVLARLGRRAEALEIIEELDRIREVEYVDAYFMAILLHAFERPDAAFQELERAAAENSATLFLLDVDPRLDPLRADPRFRRVRDRVFAPAARPGRSKAAG